LQLNFSGIRGILQDRSGALLLRYVAKQGRAMQRGGIILFDPAGRRWSPDAGGLGAVLCTDLRGEALANYVVRNMGYVALQVRNRSAHVCIRPSIVSQPALALVADYLRRFSVERVLLSIWYLGWQHHLLPASLVPGACMAAKGSWSRSVGDIAARAAL